MPRRKPTPSAKRASGPTQSKADRREAGRVRLDMWWPEDLVELLDRMRGEQSRSAALQMLAWLALGGPK